MELEHRDRHAFLPPPMPFALALRASTTALRFRAAGWLRAGAARWLGRAHHGWRAWRERGFLLVSSAPRPSDDGRLTAVLTALRAHPHWCMGEQDEPISTERARATEAITVPHRRAG